MKTLDLTSRAAEVGVNVWAPAGAAASAARARRVLGRMGAPPVWWPLAQGSLDKAGGSIAPGWGTGEIQEGQRRRALDRGGASRYLCIGGVMPLPSSKSES